MQKQYVMPLWNIKLHNFRKCPRSGPHTILQEAEKKGSFYTLRTFGTVTTTFLACKEEKVGQDLT